MGWYNGGRKSFGIGEWNASESFPESVQIMEFHEKLQELRKQKGITQEELAEALYVSRAAISKWESGRGYPNIDSLKALAKFYAVTIDTLLSGDEILHLAEEDSKQHRSRFCDLVSGLLDCSMALFFFLPFFGQKSGDGIQAVTLLALTEIPAWLNAFYCAVVLGSVLIGITTLTLQNCTCRYWLTTKAVLSTGCSLVGVFLFILSRQPYAAAFALVFLVIKALLAAKKH